ncbi:MAG: GNAT family N-acetyltransferase [Roseburia sp.]|nr:GNAT family N-acetyltransferase [Roseburia sp.]
MTDVKFHEITIQDKKWMDEKFAEDDRNACEYTFANNFIWRKVYQVEVAELYGCLLVRFVEQGEHCYSYPIGAGDKKAAITQLLFLCQKEKRPFIMSPLSEEDKKQLSEWFPGRFLIEKDRDGYDYIYSREKLATLAGKKLHGKRNHIARFKDGGDWSYEPLTGENLEECREMTYTWIRMRSEKWNEEMEEEIQVLHEAFDHMQELELTGGILRQEGQIVAFSIGERQNTDTFVVHFEKAYPDMQGAYPMINQQFVLHACEGYTYVNREDDTGDLGLRKAKLSYYPDILLKKYVARASRVVYADKEKDGEQIQKIWQTCFGDEEGDIALYLQHRMTDDNMLVIYEDGKAVSMASFLPVQYYVNGEYQAARYVYAVATLPEYRRRGLAREILEFAKAEYDEPLILAPAEESLFSYYERMGFHKAFAKRTLFPEREPISSEEWAVKRPASGNIQAAEWLPDRQQQSRESQAGELPVSDDVQAAEWHTPAAQTMDMPESVTPEEYVKIRDAHYETEGYVRWDAAAVSYAMELAASCGGAAIAVVPENESTRREQPGTEEKDILMYEKEGETLGIIETTLSASKLEQLLPELLSETGTRTVAYRQMEGMLWLPGSMRNLKVNREGYLNLTLG